MNASDFWTHIDAALADGETLEMTSDQVSTLMERHVALHDIDAEFTPMSDLGPVRCRVVDLTDIHHWNLRFWRSAAADLLPVTCRDQKTGPPRAA